MGSLPPSLSQVSEYPYSHDRKVNGEEKLTHFKAFPMVTIINEATGAGILIVADQQM
jgi:hypothetical protein